VETGKAHSHCCASLTGPRPSSRFGQQRCSGRDYAALNPFGFSAFFMKYSSYCGISLLAYSVTFLLSLLAVQTNVCGQSDDFNDGNDNGWTHLDLSAAGQAPSIYTFPPDGTGGKAYRIFSPAPSATNVGPARTFSYRADATYANFTVTVDFVAWDTNLFQAFGVLVRGTNVGLGRTEGYVFNCNPIQTPGTPGGQLQINRITGEQPTTMAIAAISLNPNRKYRLVATGSGGYLAGKLFDIADLSAAVASVDVVDQTYSSGLVGLFNYSLAYRNQHTNATSNADCTFDNFFATESASTSKRRFSVRES